MASKKRERALLNRAAAFYPELNDGDILEGESPDFVIKRADDCIGVDVTEYVHKQNPKITSDRQRETALRRQNDAARERYAQRCDVPIYVATTWAASYHPQKKEMYRLADVMAQVVVDHLPAHADGSHLIGHDVLRNYGLVTVVTSLFVLRLAAGGISSWTMSGSGPSKVFPGEIQAVIHDKNGKVARYRLKCERIWLLIVAAGDDLASSAALYDDVRDYVFESCFDRVLIVSLGDRTHADLKLTPPSFK